jgi:hypothetical protein
MKTAKQITGRSIGLGRRYFQQEAFGRWRLADARDGILNIFIGLAR